MSTAFKTNNFDLLRLFAATQVVFHHCFIYLKIEHTGIVEVFSVLSRMFPGVPIFFFVSGYLISKSFETNSNYIEYGQNRFLRLFPGLFVCVGISILVVYLTGYLDSVSVNLLDLIVLLLAKSTFFQAYNPEYLRAYGDGVLNGSLWTITVEIQFYILVPLLYLILRNISRKNVAILVLIALFLFINRIYAYVPLSYQENIIFKIIRISFFPWFYMFLLGMFFQTNFDTLYRYLKNRAVYLLAAYVVVSFICIKAGISYFNNMNPLIFLFLAVTVFSMAYSFPSLSRKLLNGNDISYGIYIYHMPVVNFLLYHNLYGGIQHAAMLFAATFTFATISWLLIERPSLRLKKHPLNPLSR